MKNIEDILLRARLQAPYFSRAFAAITLVEREMGNPPTLAVDKHWRLYWSQAALSRWTDAECAAVARHEIEHLVRDHNHRRQLRDPDVWNIVGDAEINDDVTGLPTDAVFPKNLGCPNNHTAEEYYEALAKAAKKVTGKMQCGSGSGGKKLEGELDADSSCIPEAAQESVRSAIAEDIRQQEANSPGTVPAGLVVWANTVVAPVAPYNWKQEFAKVLRKTTRALGRGKDDASWSRLSRRSRPGEPLRQGNIAFAPRIVILTDTSGSMDPHAPWALAVEEQVRKVLGVAPKRVDCDVEATVARGKVHRGGGGTDLRVGLKAAESLGDLCVVITDMETPWPAEAPKCQVVVASTAGREGLPEWAKHVKVEVR